MNNARHSTYQDGPKILIRFTLVQYSSANFHHGFCSCLIRFSLVQYSSANFHSGFCSCLIRFSLVEYSSANVHPGFCSSCTQPDRSCRSPVSEQHQVEGSPLYRSQSLKGLYSGGRRFPMHGLCRWTRHQAGKDAMIRRGGLFATGHYNAHYKVIYC